MQFRTIRHGDRLELLVFLHVNRLTYIKAHSRTVACTATVCKDSFHCIKLRLKETMCKTNKRILSYALCIRCSFTHIKNFTSFTETWGCDLYIMDFCDAQTGLSIFVIMDVPENISHTFGNAKRAAPILPTLFL